MLNDVTCMLLLSLERFYCASKICANLKNCLPVPTINQVRSEIRYIYQQLLSLIFSFCCRFCMYLVFLYLFQVFSPAILYAFTQNLSRQQQIRRMQKPVNFIRGTIENCFVPLVYSFLLSGKFCIIKAQKFCLNFWLN